MKTVLAGITIGLLCLWLTFGASKTDFEAIGLGIGTSAVYQSYDGRRIHCGDPEDAKICLKESKNNSPRTRIALLGWSQLHGINQYEEGQHGAPWILASKYAPQKSDFLTFSHGNANPQEHFVFFQWLQTQEKFDGLVIGAWMQGMREEGIRSAIADVSHDKEIRRVLEQSDTGKEALAVIAPKTGSLPSDKAFSTTQDKVENALVNWLSAHSTLWELRGEAEGRIRLYFRNIKFHVVRLRDMALGLDKSEWIWPIPPARYEKNIRFLESIVSEARAADMEVLIYIPPRPKEDPFPFSPDLYKQFKADVETFAKKHGASYANLEDCVSGDVWGMTMGGDGIMTRDITHFAVGGHEQLASCLEKEISKSFKVVR